MKQPNKDERGAGAGAAGAELRPDLESLFDEELALPDGTGSAAGDGGLRTDVALPAAPGWDPLTDGSASARSRHPTPEVSAESLTFAPVARPAVAAPDEPVDEPAATLAPGPAAAAAPPISVAEARALLDGLTSATGALRDRPAEEEALAAARQVLTEARESLDRFPKDDPSFEILRDELLDAYFGLDRLVHSAEGAAVPAAPRRPSPEKGKPQPKVTKRVKPVSRAAPAAGRPRRTGRVAALAALVVLLGGGRVAYYFFVERVPPAGPAKVVRKQSGGLVAEARLDRASGDQAKAYQQGIPIVTYLRLSRRTDGALRAAAAASDTNSKLLTLTYKWSLAGKAIAVENEGLLAVDKMQGPGTYRVEVTANDGALTSAPLSTELWVQARAPSAGAGAAPQPTPPEPQRAAPPAATDAESAVTPDAQ